MPNKAACAISALKNFPRANQRFYRLDALVASHSKKSTYKEVSARIFWQTMKLESRDAFITEIRCRSFTVL